MTELLTSSWQGDTAAQLTPGLHIDTVTSFRGLVALRPAWEELLSRAPDATAFQTWEWVATWYEHFASHDALRILVARRADGGIVCIAPCSLHRTWPNGPRLLCLLGQGHHLTEYNAPILDATLAEPAAAALMGQLQDIAGDWDLVLILNRPGKSGGSKL